MQALKFFVDAFWFSPYSFSVFVALTEKKVPFESVEIALHKKENKRAEFRHMSVTGRVPCLRHGEFALAESGAIIDYLEDAFPEPEFPCLLPANLKERARARMVLDWIRSSRDLMPLIHERGTETMFYKRATNPLSEPAQQSAAKLIEIAERMLPKEQENLFSQWCIADSDLAFALHRLIVSGDPIPDRLRRYAEKQWKRPSVKSFVERPRPDFVPY